MNEKKLNYRILCFGEATQSSTLASLSHQGLCNMLFQFLLSRESVGVLRVRSGSRQTRRLGSLWLRFQLSQEGEESVCVSFLISAHCIYRETAFVT